MNLEPAITHLEKTVMKADSRLDDISWKLDLFETEICHAVVADDAKVSVMNLLDSVTQVKEEYEHLKREIIELQALQRVVRDTLRLKAMKVQQRMIALRTKIKQHDQYALR
ncbi:uncharacterized protein LOC142322882 [Lycorma delicatula]|uniref:uncharacterized protein LOC142322882 n=1 Tax=Lycorma delicatula TaxID=130591 RepID=UPI003F519B68